MRARVISDSTFELLRAEQIVNNFAAKNPEILTLIIRALRPKNYEESRLVKTERKNLAEGGFEPPRPFWA